MLNKLALIITLIILVFYSNIQTLQAKKTVLNDIHSQLNKTVVDEVISPKSTQDIINAVKMAKAQSKAISISGGKHSMGGQQFGTDTLHLDMSRFNHVVSFDPDKGIVEVESGIEWPDLIDWLVENQKGVEHPWAIRQKQTGADKLSLGGALSANVHGRGLKWTSIIGDVESFTLVDANANLITCSRDENSELFSLVVGGYGLFGVIDKIKLRLDPRQRIQRVVEITSVDGLIDKVEERIKDGYLYGDFQFSIDPKSDKFLTYGVFATYKPVENEGAGEKTEGRELSALQWEKLYFLAHADKKQAYELYTKFYHSTNGQKYWSDTHQLSVYIDDYHKKLDKELHAKVPGSEMISEIYVPRENLLPLLKKLQEDFRSNNINVIYGTIRFLEKDDEAFLPIASNRFASIVFNFHVDHDEKGIEKAKHDFRLLIDRALEMGGSYFLTYHRWARKDQVLKAYPQFVKFLKLKKQYDPDEVFQSDWYRHYREMFKGEL